MSNYSPEQLASLAKERPRNETEKRFVLSPEEFSKKRFEAVKDEVAEIQEKNPEVLSFCVYGSMVKGTAHEGSDIDGFLFIDSALAAEKAGVSEEEILQKHPRRNQILFAPEIAQKYSSEFQEGIMHKAELGPEYVKDIRCEPISEKVIDDEIRSVIGYYNNSRAYKIEAEKWSAAKPPRGSDIDTLLVYERSKPQEPVFMTPSLGGMFHLDVGGGIRKYRKMFVEKLAQLGPDGEKLWTETIGGTERFENNFSSDPTKRYARTLEEAKKLYL